MTAPAPRAGVPEPSCVQARGSGFEQSGLGREGGPEGIGAFLETKLIQGI